MKIITVNGISSDGSKNTDLIGQDLHEFCGYDVFDCNQKIRHTWSVRSKKNRYEDARGVADVIEQGDWIIAHSYGGYKSSKALKMCALDSIIPAGLIMLNPAVSRSYYERARILRYTTTQIYCFHSMDDWAIWWGGQLWGHEFGTAGRKGFKGDRVNNFEIVGGHSDSFTDVMRPLRVKQFDGIIQGTGLTV